MIKSLELELNSLGEECQTSGECKEEYSICGSIRFENYSIIKTCACRNGIDSDATKNKCKSDSKGTYTLMKLTKKI